MARIFILNPNSSEAVTEAMRQSVALIRDGVRSEVVFGTLAGAPAGIESQADVEAVVLPAVERLAGEAADAHVLGCFSDPGLMLARERIAAPVVGIAEAAYGEAVSMGMRFGVVSIVKASIGRHRRAIAGLGFSDFLAGDRSLDIGVAGMGEAGRVLARMDEIGGQLRDLDGAECLILGCASMGVYREAAQERLGLPVIDPVQAAVLRADRLITLRYPQAGHVHRFMA